MDGGKIKLCFVAKNGQVESGVLKKSNVFLKIVLELVCIFYYPQLGVIWKKQLREVKFNEFGSMGIISMLGNLLLLTCHYVVILYWSRLGLRSITSVGGR